MRRAYGMPPRDKERKSERRQSSTPPPYGRRRTYRSNEPLIPKEYAEDVAFTEVHSYSEETEIGPKGDSTAVRTESQVSDAEIIEIRKEK